MRRVSLYSQSVSFTFLKTHSKLPGEVRHRPKEEEEEEEKKKLVFVPEPQYFCTELNGFWSFLKLLVLN